MKTIHFWSLLILFPGILFSKDHTLPLDLKEILSLPMSAASGLVYVDQTFYVISDDELSLFKFSKNRPYESFKLIEGELPEENSERKKRKPDFESLYLRDRRIVAMPSLSKKNRIVSANFDLETKKSEINDLSKLYRQALELTKNLDVELNIEGSVVVGDDLWLFQRGNSKKSKSGIFQMKSHEIDTLHFMAIELGKIEDTPLGFTDAVKEGNNIYFLAAAESSKSTYGDGKYLGAILGKMDLKGRILKTMKLPSPYKPEGLVIDKNIAYFVTDADDRKIPSKLYQMTLPEGF